MKLQCRLLKSDARYNYTAPMSLLTLSKRILGKNDKVVVKNKKVKAAATVATKKKQTVDTAALPSGMIGLIEIISEKGIRQQEQGTAVFRVLHNVTKGHITQVIESRYGIKVRSVRTLQMNPKNRRRGVTEGKTNRWKKAYVTVDNIQALTHGN